MLSISVPPFSRQGKQDGAWVGHKQKARVAALSQKCRRYDMYFIPYSPATTLRGLGVLFAIITDSSLMITYIFSHLFLLGKYEILIMWF